MLMDVVRYACGQINKSESVKAQEAAKKAKDGERIPPSPKIKAARELFSARCFKGGNQGGHAGDPIGQLWLLGKLDMPDMDDARLLMTARDWWHARSIVFKDLAHKTAKYERASRTSNASADPTKTERSYYRYSSFLLDAADYDVDCLESLMEETLDGDIVSWVSRIIQTELLRFVRLPLAELACDDDYARLDAARRALRALAGAGALRRDAA
jgi:hypothetical protein